MNNNELAEKIINSKTWDYDLLAELCDRAGVFEEWEMPTVKPLKA